MRRGMLEINSIHFLIGTLIASISFLIGTVIASGTFCFSKTARLFKYICFFGRDKYLRSAVYIYKSIRGRKASEIKVICIPVAERLAGA